jgi:hypothetical protein
VVTIGYVYYAKRTRAQSTFNKTGLNLATVLDQEVPCSIVGQLGATPVSTQVIAAPQHNPGASLQNQTRSADG